MEIKVKRHYKIDTFNKFSLLMNYDAVASVFSFNLYFDPNNFEHKLLFQPGHYHILDVSHGGELLMRGYILGNTFGLQSEKQLSNVNGYSLAGVLEDCQIPPDLYPLQSDEKTLKEIADRLVSKFPFAVEVDTSVSDKLNQVYDVTTASESGSIKDYLSSLASQKNVILTHTPTGNLLFTKAKTKQKPILHFTQGMPMTTMSLSFKGQGMHSHITVQKQADIDGGNVGENTVRNPFVPYVYRPKVKIQNSGDDIDTSEAAKNELAAEYKNIILTITTDMWEIDGKVIKPNNIISVVAPELYLYKKSNWFIQSVKLDGDESSTTATLTCVLPAVYDNSTPPYIFEIIEEKEHG